MIKFIKEKTPDDQFDLTEIEIKCDVAYAGDLVDVFKQFMLACGFAPGTVDKIVFDGEE
jgi:hypothetical protein